MPGCRHARRNEGGPRQWKNAVQGCASRSQEH
jgi:hypothetical protein